jgi:hypothetical protein
MHLRSSHQFVAQSKCESPKKVSLISRTFQKGSFKFATTQHVEIFAIDNQINVLESSDRPKSGKTSIIQLSQHFPVIHIHICVENSITFFIEALAL